MESNLFAGVKALKGEREREWVLIPEEEQRLLQECDNRPQRRKYLRHLVLFALNTGMRESEIFKLKIANIHLDKRYIDVVDTKNGIDRAVPINDTLMAVSSDIDLMEGLNAVCGIPNGEHLFCNDKGKRLTVLTNAFWKAVEEAGLFRYERDSNGRESKEKLRFHGLRHTFGSRLGMSGADVKTIMEIMGHKTFAMSMRYQHPTPTHKLKAVIGIDRLYMQSF